MKYLLLLMTLFLLQACGQKKGASSENSSALARILASADDYSKVGQCITKSIIEEYSTFELALVSYTDKNDATLKSQEFRWFSLDFLKYRKESLKNSEGNAVLEVPLFGSRNWDGAKSIQQLQACPANTSEVVLNFIDMKNQIASWSCHGPCY